MTEIPANDSCADASSPARDLFKPSNLPAGGKSTQSYIALISMAILSSAEKRLVLGDIYKILTRWQPERYNTSTLAWRNSIRHNLSLNECFVKAGRAANGKGNYWAIHPACVDSFSRGDYRRRHARRKAVACKSRSAASASLAPPSAAAESSDCSGQQLATSVDTSDYTPMSQVTVFNGCSVGRLSVEQLVSLIPQSVSQPQPNK